MCPQEPDCFELLVKPEFIALTGERITVRFTASTRLYDPENYELTMQQQNIVAGSHLRLLLEADTNGLPGTYHATFIWIGD